MSAGLTTPDLPPELAAPVRPDGTLLPRPPVESATAVMPVPRSSTSRFGSVWMPRPGERFLVRYGVAVLAIAVAWGLSVLLEPLAKKPSNPPLFYLAVLVGAWFGGSGPGLLCTALAGVITAVYFIDPPGSLSLKLDDLVRLSVFLSAALLIGFLTATRRRTESALKRAHGALQRAHNDLEARVKVRTAELEQSNELLRQHIAERRRAEDALRQSDERFRLLIEGVEDYAVFLLGPDGKVVSWNAAAERITGYGEPEVTGAAYEQFFTPEDVQLAKPVADLEKANTAGRAEDEGWRVRKDGSRFWADVSLSALRDEAGDLRGFAAVMRDVTERRELERAMLEISEREQQRIGNDLHDGLGQELTGIAFLAKALAEALSANQLPEAEEAQEVAALVNRAIAQTRELARGLYPTELEADGLHTALKHLALRAEKLFNLSCTVEADPTLTVADRAAARHLYRIAQEAIHNAVKHGHCRKVTIALTPVDGGAVLAVQDDGKGFVPPMDGQAGMGLNLMGHRARMIGGKLEVGPLDGGGTAVTCTWPNTPEEGQKANGTGPTS